MYKVYVSSTCSVQSMRIENRGRCAVLGHDFSLLFARFQLVRPNGWWMLAYSRPMCSFLLEVEGLMNEGRIEKSWRDVWDATTKFACYDRTSDPFIVSIPFVHVWLTNALQNFRFVTSVSTNPSDVIVAKLIFNVKSRYKMAHKREQCYFIYISVVKYFIIVKSFSILKDAQISHISQAYRTLHRSFDCPHLSSLYCHNNFPYLP